MASLMNSPHYISDYLGRTSSHIPTIATRVAVWAICVIAVSAGLDPRASLLVDGALLAYYALLGKPRFAFASACFIAIFFALYAALFYADAHIFVFSPASILATIRALPAVLSFFGILVAPPGMISSALAKIACPKKIIVAVLVMIRFIPTFTSFFRRYRDAVRLRGLLRLRRVCANPASALEYVIVPALLSLATSADQLATSAIARAAQAPRPRTSYYTAHFSILDAAALVLIISLSCAAVALTRMIGASS